MYHFTGDKYCIVNISNLDSITLVNKGAIPGNTINITPDSFLGGNQYMKDEFFE